MFTKAFSFGSVFVGVFLLLFGCHSSRDTVVQQTDELPNTLLWKVESPDLDAPSYLFGTIHLIPEENYFWPAHFQEAFSTAEQVALETNELDMDPTAMMGMMPKLMMPAGQSLEDLVSEEEYARIQDFFEEMGLPLMFMKSIKPFFLYMLVDIDLGSLFGEGIKSYEMELTEQAKAENKAVLGLETMDYQMSIFDSIPYADQAYMLVQAIDQKYSQDPEKEETEANALYQTYMDQDLNAILTQVEDMDVTIKRFNKLFLDDRNRNWIPKIEQLMDQKSTFIAVGAAHLPGQTGVIRLLRDAGYTLTPVLNPGDGTH